MMRKGENQTKKKEGSKKMTACVVKCVCVDGCPATRKLGSHDDGWKGRVSEEKME